MTDTQIQCFLTLADNLNFTRTAHILGISQSTLSAHIAALEKGLDQVLFIRNKRNVALSVAGEIMYKTFKDVTAMVDDALQSIHQMEREKQDRIIVGLMEGQWSQRIIECISETFLQENPEIQLRIKTFGNAELLEQLDLGTVDMIMGYANVLELRQDLSSLPIYESPLYLTKRAGEVDALLENKELLETQCFILQDKKRAPFFEKYFETWCQTYGVEPVNILRVENKASVLLNIEMGRGIGLIDDLSIIYGKSQYEFEVVKNIETKYDLIYKSGHTKKILADYVAYIKERYSSRLSRSVFKAGL